MLALETLTACPLCESSEVVHLDEAFRFDQCKSCGYIFDNPRPTQSAIAQHYSRPEQYDDWLRNFDAREKLWKRRLKKMLPDRAPGSLLDVGAGIGQFLALARDSFSSVDGTELSESAISIAKERYGLTIRHGTIETLKLPTYDNITMVHVLEHVLSPKDTLKRCFEVLNPGGRIFICVPNDIDSWKSRHRAIRGRLHVSEHSPAIGLLRAGDLAEIHLSHFTTKTLSFAARQAGFRVVKVDIDPLYVATGRRLIVSQLEYGVHKLLHLPTYHALWLVAEKPKH
jgi:SAM-dependent methyltransferase